MRLALLGLLTIVAAPLSAQRFQIDPDWCWWCKDSQQHFAAGASLDLAANILLPKSHAWQRVLIITVAATAFELGQEEDARDGGQVGPGYGFGTKDLIVGVSGAIFAEIVWASLRPSR
ncbi:MAG TPA: hypothetical protein VKD28_16695 [Gemmatimonadales bacterium]|nr:hypothetical protein [Gemmatimonadales bacterium]